MYNNHIWIDGEVITAAKLNNMENGILTNAMDMNLASEFSTDNAYTAGQYVIEYGDLYRFVADKAAGAWDSTKVVAVVLCDDVANKANTDGSYADMTVGMAENLVSSVGIDDKTPYNFRTSGGSVDIGGRERVDAVVGVTVAWNQMAGAEMEKHLVSVTQTAVHTKIVCTSNTSSIKKAGAEFPSNHKIYVRLDNVQLVSITGSASPYVGMYNGITEGSYSFRDFLSNGMNYAKVVQTTATYNTLCVGFGTSNKTGSTIECDNLQMIDLTQMFGSTIADYIYALEQSNAGAGVAYFRKLFPNPYYGYSAPTLLSVKTSAHKMVGFNAYDNSEGKAKVVGGNVYQITGTYTALTLNGSTITPDASGYFTPSENGEITVTGGNATDTCIHLKWDGERDGEYEAYQEWTYALDSDLELRGTPKLDANNKLYYDGDTYAPDGTVTRNYEYRAYASGDESLADAITDGTHTVAKLVTPTTESADEYQQTQNVSDWGTEEYVDSRAVPIPVGHNTFYQANLKAKLEMAPDSPSDGDGLYVVQQISGENTYVPLVVPNEIPDAPTTDGTYVLKATVSGGTATYSWVSE